MLELITVKPKNLIAYRVEGKVTAQDFERVAKVIEDRLEEQDDVAVYAQIDSLEGMEPTAVVKDVAFGIRNAGKLSKVDRVAVVTDEDWIQNATKVEDAVLPGIDMSAFPKAESERAMAWVLSGAPAATTASAS